MLKQHSLPNRRERQSVSFFPVHYLWLKTVSPFGHELPFVERESLGKIIFENLSARYEHYLNNKDSRDLHPRLFCYGPPGWCRYYHYSQKQELEKVERSWVYWNGHWVWTNQSTERQVSSENQKVLIFSQWSRVVGTTKETCEDIYLFCQRDSLHRWRQAAGTLYYVGASCPPLLFSSFMSLVRICKTIFGWSEQYPSNHILDSNAENLSRLVWAVPNRRSIHIKNASFR